MKLLAAAALVTAIALQAAGPQRGVPVETLRQMAQPLGAEPIDVLDAEKQWAGVEPLMQLAAPLDQSLEIREAAVRALGRLEDPRVVPQILALKGKLGNSARASAVAQSLHGLDPAVDPGLIDAATSGMFVIGSVAITNNDVLDGVLSVALPLSRIAFPDAGRVHEAEKILLKVLTFTASDPRKQGAYLSAIHAFESLARVNQKVTALDEDTKERLSKAVEGTSSNDTDDARFYAFLALNAGRSLDADTERIALKDDYWQLRRVAATVLAGGGAGIEDEPRLDLIQALFEDKDAHVRYDALRAYVRRGARTRGCGPIEGMLGDPEQHVSLAAMDALGDLCKTDSDLTDRIAADARVPPTVGSWHRETHAFVALAKRSAEKAAGSMEAFVSHPVWWVRMYAAGAAAVTGDLPHLEKLVYDSNDNVREAALDPWRRLKKADAVPAILDALTRTDVQLLRTSATLLKDAPKSDEIYRALLGALRRLTTEGKETSRDARIRLLETMAFHARPEYAGDLVPLLKDFDPRVAGQAAQLISSLTGKAAVPEPVPYRRGWPQEFKDLRQCVVVNLATAGSFRMRMLPASAPIAVGHFLKLATKDKYYDGLTIHRVVPNFVIQMGSPNANEYSGAKEFMRDEIAGGNWRGTVGLSTRGRNTGDAQFFVNVVDNPRLNGDYTIFASVLAADLPVVDKIQEGEVMRSINLTKCSDASR